MLGREQSPHFRVKDVPEPEHAAIQWERDDKMGVLHKWLHYIDLEGLGPALETKEVVRSLGLLFAKAEHQDVPSWFVVVNAGNFLNVAIVRPCVCTAIEFRC